jgi:large subunit ribosomal protein L4e
MMVIRMAEKISIYDLTGVPLKEMEKPPIFKLPIRYDLIRRAFVFQHSHKIQPKGRYPLAGRDTSAEYFGVGLGLARIPRYKQGHLRGTGAIVAMARGGRKPHVTTPEKRIYKRINRKELRLAILSAISATGSREMVEKRGHRISNVPEIPLIVSSEVEEIERTSELIDVLDRLGLMEDIERVKNNIKIVGGKAKWRGRRKKVRVGPLIVYGEDERIVKAARNIIGVDIVPASDVSVIHLAPGGMPGRLTLWSEKAINILKERFGNMINRYLVIKYG